MATRRKKRGYDYTNGKGQMSLEERRKQWNINLANRALETMYDDIDFGDGVKVLGKRKRVTYTADTLYAVGREYFTNIVEANENDVTIIPDIEDFCMFARISRGMFMQYRRSEDLDMQSVANNIATAIANCKKQSALQGTLNPTIFAIDFNNNHDYVQAKTELTLNQNVSLQQVETNIADIANRLPMMDEGGAIDVNNESV